MCYMRLLYRVYSYVVDTPFQWDCSFVSHNLIFFLYRNQLQIVIVVFLSPKQLSKTLSIFFAQVDAICSVRPWPEAIFLVRLNRDIKTGFISVKRSHVKPRPRSDAQKTRLWPVFPKSKSVEKFKHMGLKFNAQYFVCFISTIFLYMMFVSGILATNILLNK